MATLAQFQTELQSVLGLDIEDSDSTMADLYINEGVTDVMLRTHCKVLELETDTTAGEPDYTLPTPILAILELHIQSETNNYPLERVTHADILRLRRTNPASSYSPQAYTVVGANLLMLYPTPAEVLTVTGLYVPRPAPLSAGTDTPSEIPAEWHKAVSFYALARAADMDDDTTSEQGERYRGLYEGAIQAMRRDIYRHGGSRMAPARVKRRRRQFLAHDNSTD